MNGDHEKEPMRHMWDKNMASKIKKYSIQDEIQTGDLKISL